jgi:hypothetical protein
MKNYKCRICKENIKIIFCDLGRTPLSNSFLNKNELLTKEKAYPLKVFFCKKCYLFQLPKHADPIKIFRNYDYFSSYSKIWQNHCKNFTDTILKNYRNKVSYVCEIGSNDGTLLKFFKKKKIKTLGIEPARNIAKFANKSKIYTINKFFTNNLAKKLISRGYNIDLIVCNNVLAQAPNIIDFTKGIKTLLAKNGIVTIEVPHVLNLIKFKQFDTIYHEHYSYFSLLSLKKLFGKYELEIYNVNKLSTHGGSIRIFCKHTDNKFYKIEKNVSKIINEEISNKIFEIKNFYKFQKSIKEIKIKFNLILNKLKINKKYVIAYGAPAKGNTLLNYCGIKKKLIKFTIDKNPIKVGKYLPGSHIPIYKSSDISQIKPDYVVILPWNLEKEIINELKVIF